MDSDELTKGHITACKKLYRQLRYSRNPNYGSKYMDKGNMMEEEAITLLCRLKKMFLTKNKERLINDFISGHPDLFNGKDILKTKEGWDTKCSWDVFTFPFPDEKLDSKYYWQNMGYLWLTGAEKWTTSYCLVNAPANLILAEKTKVFYRLGCPDATDPEYIHECIEIEKNMIFDMAKFVKDYPNFDLDCKDWQYDIPIKERLIEFEVVRRNYEIELIKERVIKCREYLNDLEKNYNPSVLLAHLDSDNGATIIEGSKIPLIKIAK